MKNLGIAETLLPLQPLYWKKKGGRKLRIMILFIFFPTLEPVLTRRGSAL